MLGEWIGVSLDRLFTLTGTPVEATAADVAVLAAEVPRDGARSGTRTHPAVTIVKWRVFAHDKAEQNADLATG